MRVSNFRARMAELKIDQTDLGRRMRVKHSQGSRYINSGIPIDRIADFLDALELQAVPDDAVVLERKRYEGLLLLAQDGLQQNLEDD
jgi:hypothetical protein